MKLISPKYDYFIKEMFCDPSVLRYFIGDVLEVHVLELKKNLTGHGEIDDWIRFFNVETAEDLKMIKTKNPGILQAIGLLQRLSMNNPLRLRYEAYLKQVRDERAWKTHVWKEAMSEGIAQGMAESILDLLRLKGQIPEALRAEIPGERDVKKRRLWLRFAAQCQTGDEFQNNIHGK